MDPITIATLVIGGAQVAFKGAKAAGLIGDSAKSTKYIGAGLEMLANGAGILGKLKANPNEYDTMSEEQIRALIMPEDWNDIEADVKASLGIV